MTPNGFGDCLSPLAVQNGNLYSEWIAHIGLAFSSNQPLPKHNLTESVTQSDYFSAGLAGAVCSSPPQY